MLYSLFNGGSSSSSSSSSRKKAPEVVTTTTTTTTTPEEQGWGATYARELYLFANSRFNNPFFIKTKMCQYGAKCSYAQRCCYIHCLEDILAAFRCEELIDFYRRASIDMKRSPRPSLFQVRPLEAFRCETTGCRAGTLTLHPILSFVSSGLLCYPQCRLRCKKCRDDTVVEIYQ